MYSAGARQTASALACHSPGLSWPAAQVDRMTPALPGRAGLSCRNRSSPASQVSAIIRRWLSLSGPTRPTPAPARHHLSCPATASTSPAVARQRRSHAPGTGLRAGRGGSGCCPTAAWSWSGTGSTRAVLPVPGPARYPVNAEAQTTGIRIQRLRVQLASPGTAQVTLARAAADCGYFDQAHLCHDSARLAGITPTELLCPRSQPTGRGSGARFVLE